MTPPVSGQTTALEDWNQTREMMKWVLYGSLVLAASMIVARRLGVPEQWVFVVGFFSAMVFNLIVGDRRRYGSVDPLRILKSGQLIVVFALTFAYWAILR